MGIRVSKQNISVLVTGVLGMAKQKVGGRVRKHGRRKDAH